MKYKTLCRLLIQLLGVYFLGLACIAIWHSAMETSLYLMGTYGYSRSISLVNWFFTYLLRPAADVAVGLYLFSGGKWVLDRMIPSNRPYCHECGYELTGAAGSICPECGTAFRPIQVADVEPHH